TTWRAISAPSRAPIAPRRFDTKPSERCSTADAHSQDVGDPSPAQVPVRSRKYTPDPANNTLGAQAARNGGSSPIPPRAFVVEKTSRKTATSDTAIPIPYSEPRLPILKQKGIPRMTIVRETIGSAVLS